MKFFLVALLFCVGCSSMTVHEYCTKNEARYASYNQCYAEETADREAEAARWAAASQGFNQGYNNYQQQNRTINCTTFGNQTSCY